AEDGIRDFHVTGVQTCALPICTSTRLLRKNLTPIQNPERSLQLLLTRQIEHALPAFLDAARKRFRVGIVSPLNACLIQFCAKLRSEERRVGKELRSRAGRARLR